MSIPRTALLLTRRIGPLAIGGALLLGGCHSGTEASVKAPAAKKDPAAEMVESFEANLSELLEANAREAHDPTGMNAALEATEGLHDPQAVRKILETDDWRFRFVRRSELTPAGEALMEALSGAPDVALDAADYHVPRLEAAREKLSAQAAAIRRESGDAPALSEAEKDELAGLLREKAVNNPEAAHELLVDAILDGDPEASPVPAAARWHAERIGRLETLSGASTTMELLLTDAAVRYAADVRFFNPHNLDQDAVAGKGREVVTRERSMAFASTLRALAADDSLDKDATREAVAGRLADLHPEFPQYDKLKAALARYRAIKAEGGWPTAFPHIPRPKHREKPVRYGSKTRRVPETLVLKIKKRLAAEGFYDGNIDDTFSDDLNDALYAYRKTHQLWEKAWIDYDLLSSMKLPVDYRIAQIELSLQRWRESRIGDDDYYVHVNVPAFHGEVWDGGELKHRFRVIVGKANRYRDRDTREWRYPNATPLFSAKMESVVFSPYWNVPYRIKKRELDPKLEKNPDWYEEHGYEVYTTSAGHEMVRQKPGPKNALGKVKLLFPNDHDVYIHDTQDKRLFNAPIRAFSHGCMRAKDPLDVAHVILSRQSDFWSMRRVRAYGAGTKESWHRLEDGPMVHVEYFTVRVDEEGNANFLADVYDHDAKRIAEEWGLKDGLD